MKKIKCDRIELAFQLNLAFLQSLQQEVRQLRHAWCLWCTPSQTAFGEQGLRWPPHLEGNQLVQLGCHPIKYWWQAETSIIILLPKYTLQLLRHGQEPPTCCSTDQILAWSCFKTALVHIYTSLYSRQSTLDAAWLKVGCHALQICINFAN